MKSIKMDGTVLTQTPEVQFLKRLDVAVATWFLPRIIDTIGQLAAKGDLEAAKLLFDLLQPPPNSIQHQPKPAPTLKELLAAIKKSNPT